MASDTGGNGGASASHRPGNAARREASTFPPVLNNLQVYIDEATGLVCFSGRERLAIVNTELTVPVFLIQQIFHAVLGSQLASAGAAPTLKG